MNPVQRAFPLLIACSLVGSVALPGRAFAKGPCPPMVRKLPLKYEHKNGFGGASLVSYPQEGDNGPRYDTAITTMGMFWAGSRLIGIDFQNVVSLHPETTIVLQSYANPNRKQILEHFFIGEQISKSLHFDLKRPLLFTEKGMDADLYAREGSEEHTLPYRGVVLHLDVSKWFCKIPL